jgi:anaerobic selenocysteine-containing dehydrogenase
MYANTRDVLAGILNVDFLSVADLFMSPTAEHADIVLPVAHWLEMDDIGDMPARWIVSAVNKAVEPPGEAWPDNKIFNELGKRVAPQYWFNDVEEMLDYQLKKANVTWKEFSQIGYLARMKDEQPYYKYKTDYLRKGGGFDTNTGKVELYSTVLEKLGYDPLPHYAEPDESPYSTPELYKEFPLILCTGGRLPYYFHGQYRQIPWLRELQPYPLVQIHPDTAKKYGIEDGDWVWIESPRGRIKQKTRLYTGIDARMVIAQSSWWYPDKPGPLHGILETNTNILTSNESFDPATGAPNFRALLCRIHKVKEGE